MNVLNLIKENYALLTHTQRCIADYLLANPEDICYISLHELSEKTVTSEITILRFCKRLGYGGFLELKNAFRERSQSLAQMNAKSNYIVPDMPPSPEYNQKIELLRETCTLDYDQYTDFYKTLDYDTIIECAKRMLSAQTVLICGHDVSKIIADFLRLRLNVLGINAISVRTEETSTVQAYLTKFRPGDHLVAITFPHYFTPIHNIAKYAEYKGATVTAITDSMLSPAITQNSHNLLCKTSAKVFYNSLTLPMALINIIASTIVIEMGPRYDKFVNDYSEVADFIGR